MFRFTTDNQFIESLRANLKSRGCVLSREDMPTVISLVQTEVLHHFVDRLISQVEAILDIDPFLTEKEILEGVARNVVEYFGAEAATIRIYDPERNEMISFGGYPAMASGNHTRALP